MPPTLLTPLELSWALDIEYAEVLRLAKADRIPSIPVGKRKYFNLGSVVKSLRQPAPEPPETRPCAM
jgi:hypothetical protein